MKIKHILISTIATLVLVGCSESQQSPPAPEIQLTEPAAEVPAQPSPSALEAEPDQPVSETVKPEPPTAKAPDISMHKAAEAGNITAIKQHLDAGADVNATHDGWTPLHYAASAGHKEVAELLIAKGAAVNVKNDLNDRTPLDWATHPDNPNNTAETADLLRKHGGKTSQELKAEGK